MHRAMLVAVAFSCFVVEGKAVAQNELQLGWRIVVSLTSRDLANEKAELISSAGLSWPDGRQAVVTFWKAENSLFRCIDYFDKDFRQTGSACYAPAKK